MDYLTYSWTHGITILYHLHQCRPCTSRDFHAKVGKGGINLVITHSVLIRMNTVHCTEDSFLGSLNAA